MAEELFVEMEATQFTKTGQEACGDDVQLMRIEKEHRSLAALSDGLGSGVKAHVLSNMTTTMALRFMQSNLDLLQSVEIIMDSLPVCEVRKISYSTFSFFDYRLGGHARIIEMGNPAYVHLRGVEEVSPIKDRTIVSQHWPDREVREAEAEVKPGDRFILCSDGVTQSGLGTGKAFKFGWRRSGMMVFAREQVGNEPDISAADLARRIACFAKNITPEACKDDISCLVIYCRHPRVMRVLTGPPFYRENDAEFAGQACLGEDHVVICGGTTANILERELGGHVKIDMQAMRHAGHLPPSGILPGVGLCTEGILTLSHVCKCLEEKYPVNEQPMAARQILERMLNHDRIEFVIGTKVNESHQDPNIPQELELRRSVFRRLQAALEKNYRKTVTVNYY